MRKLCCACHSSSIAALIYIIVVPDIHGQKVDTENYQIAASMPWIHEQRQPFICRGSPIIMDFPSSSFNSVCRFASGSRLATATSRCFPSLRRIDHAALERQGGPAPDICKRLGQLIDQNIIMIGRRFFARPRSSVTASWQPLAHHGRVRAIHCGLAV
jgi:hypothetical protein